MVFGRSKRRQQEREAATKERMRLLNTLAAYKMADPDEVNRQVRNRTDAATRSKAREADEAAAS